MVHATLQALYAEHRRAPAREPGSKMPGGFVTSSEPRTRARAGERQ